MCVHTCHVHTVDAARPILGRPRHASDVGIFSFFGLIYAFRCGEEMVMPAWAMICKHGKLGCDAIFGLCVRRSSNLVARAEPASPLARV